MSLNTSQQYREQPWLRGYRVRHESKTSSQLHIRYCHPVAKQWGINPYLDCRGGSSGSILCEWSSFKCIDQAQCNAPCCGQLVPWNEASDVQPPRQNNVSHLDPQNCVTSTTTVLDTWSIVVDKKSTYRRHAIVMEVFSNAFQPALRWSPSSSEEIFLYVTSHCHPPYAQQKSAFFPRGFYYSAKAHSLVGVFNLPARGVAFVLPVSSSFLSLLGEAFSSGVSLLYVQKVWLEYHIW